MFGTAAAEAVLLDPCQRLLLEAAAEAAAACDTLNTDHPSSAIAAGKRHSGSSLLLMRPGGGGGFPGQQQPGKGGGGGKGARQGGGGGPAGPADVGVFVGASYAEWSLLQQQLGLPPSTYSASGSGLSVLAGAVRWCDGGGTVGCAGLVGGVAVLWCEWWLLVGGVGCLCCSWWVLQCLRVLALVLVRVLCCVGLAKWVLVVTADC
jgi:hypothetical protein